jgi:hypothetical protein
MSPARLPKFGDAGLTGLRDRRLTARRKGAAEVTTPTLSRNIVISVVLALAAAVALVLYTNHVQDSAKSSGDAVRVVVVTRDIKAGTAVSSAAADGDLAYRTVRRSDLGCNHRPCRQTDEPGIRAISIWSPRRRMRSTCCCSPMAKGTEINCVWPGNNTEEKRTTACLSSSPSRPITESTVVTTCHPSDCFTQ